MPIDITKDSPQIALKKLKARESVLRQFEEIAGLGSWEIDLKTKKSIWSKRSYEIYGLEYGTEVTIETFFSMLLPQYVKEGKRLLKKAKQTGKTIKFNCKLRRKDGAVVDLLINGRVIYDEHGEALKLIGTTQDISSITQLQEEYLKQAKLLEHQAYHDTLTGLPNRTLFQDRLEQAIISAKRNNKKIALFFVDLDQFKKINDSLGHHIGDEVLIEAAKRFQTVLREADTLSRLGGDEFTVIVKNIKNEKEVAKVAQKLINSMQEPLNTSHHTLHISSSIGISIYPTDATSQEDLIKYADTAMYKAKEEGRNNFQFYSSEMTKKAYEKVVMENSLRVAIKEKEFEVYFQPQYDAIREKIIGMEALIRWKHPKIGIIPPMEFIPLAEESGLIIEIDKIVMKQAMKQFCKWYDKGLNPGILALNLSMRQLNENTFITELFDAMKKLDFQTQWLELEVKEGQVMSNPEQSIKKLTHLSRLGIKVIIDDFGTGYSSLSYLKKLPLNKLKINRSFIRNIQKNKDDFAITKAIIALAKSLDLELIAEGVETKEQRDYIVENGCKSIQGYYYSKPLNSKDMTALLSET
jgi:diguanylate cyclase (GGDEF)-like protein/PAS domain S-box-containing protein